jgi:cell division GTPase FtsZ
MNEVEFIHEIMRTKIKEGVDFIWLAYFNSELNEEVKVTLFISIDK